MLVGVDAPHFNAGIILRDGVCVDAAPILRWCVGKRRAELSAYFTRKGWAATIENEDFGEVK